jgi:hypothetical protein
MTYSVYQHWDPLKVCIVGRSYPPEFYSWITIPHVRKLFEKIAIETEEDYQNIIKKLTDFGVEIMRPTLLENPLVNNKFLPPPMTPRDHMTMIGDTFYTNYNKNFLKSNYDKIKDPSWPDCNNWHDFYQLPATIQEECIIVHNIGRDQLVRHEYSDIFDRIADQGNKINNNYPRVNGAMVSRIGKDLYFGTDFYDENQIEYKKSIDKEFKNTRNHIVNTGGHSDGTYCPVCPGLIISLKDIPTYSDTFPGWEVIYLPHQSWDKIRPFLKLKEKNLGKWWIPGFEQDQDVINTVEKWLGHWTGYVEETVFDINMLIIDPKNVMVFNYNKQVFATLDRYGITPHIVPFRHRYFWDGGIHCVTSDLHREGTMQDYFLERKNEF